jgi:hypothetical protein
MPAGDRISAFLELLEEDALVSCLKFQGGRRASVAELPAGIPPKRPVIPGRL